MRSSAVLLAFVLASALTAPARTAPAAERVTIAMASQGTMDYVALDAAHALDYFSEQGLDVELQYFASGTLATTALLSGTVDFTAAAFDQAMKTALKGEPLTTIAASPRSRASGSWSAARTARRSDSRRTSRATRWR